MTDETRQEETAQTTERASELDNLLQMARKVLLAGVGAVALAQEEAEAFVKKLIERGEIAEKDGEKLLHEMRERRREVASRAEEELTRRLEKVLTKMNVPTRADIETLSERIAALSRKIDELKKD